MPQRLCLSLLAALALAACGASTSTTSSSASGAGSASTSTAADQNLCVYFPKADAERITGIALVESNGNSASDCTYDRSDNPDHVAVVTVNRDTGPNQPHQYEFDRTHPVGTDVLVDVTGIGDRAFFSAGLHMLVALKGNDLIHVFVADTSLLDRDRDLDTRIAQLVLANLP